jgi:hypothetical protein
VAFRSQFFVSIALFADAFASDPVGKNCPAPYKNLLRASERFEAVSPARFRKAYLNSKHPKYPDRIWLRTEAEFHETGGSLYLSADELVGFGISQKGELISLFNNGSKGRGEAAVHEAIRLGATHLHCWGEDLVHYYERFGFRVTGSAGWREEVWVNDTIPPDPKPRIYPMEPNPSAPHKS